MGQPGVLVNGVAYNTFKANGCYDPNATGVGHQPRGWDEHVSLYNKYVVLGSKITFQPTQLDSTDTNVGYFGIIKRTNTEQILGQTTSIGDIMEARKGVYRRMNGFRSGGRPLTLTSKYSHKKHFNTKPTEHTLQTTTDPHGDALANFDVYMIPNASETGNPGPCPCLITIEYIVLFKDPKHLAQS